jgi:protein ImuB
VHRLVHVLGPERIAGEWWRGHHKTRDYYDVTDESGNRFWVFRVMSLSKPQADTIGVRWFLHGLFQ